MMANVGEIPMRLMLLATTVFAFACVEPAFAQRSLFDQPVTNPTPQASPAPAAPAPAAPVPASPAPAAPAARPAPSAAAPAVQADEPAAAPKRQAKRAKSRGPARSLTVRNATPTALVALQVSQEGRGAQLKKALGPGKRTQLALPAFKACEVTVSATFEGQAAGEATPVDICKEKVLNFKD